MLNLSINHSALRKISMKRAFNKMTMAEFQVRDVMALAKRAGAEIMAMRPLVIANPEIKGDGSPVTLADKRASDIVIAGLAQLTPAIPVISEESPDAANRAIMAAHERYWIVDPLDGTRSYIDGFDGFGIHIGMIDQGVPVVGIIYFPALDVFYYTDNGKAYCQEQGNTVRELKVKTLAETGDPVSAAVSWKKHRQPEGFRCIEAVGGARVCITAEGQTDIAVIEAPFSYWDIAAAHAVLRAAGGELFDMETGAPTRYPAGSLAIMRAVGGHADVVGAHRVRVLTAANDLLKQNGASRPKP